MEQKKEVIEKGDIFIVYKPEEYENHPEGQAMIAVSSFMYNEVLNQISFIPICTENLKQIPSHVKLKAYNGYAYCERLRRLPKWCVGEYLGKLTPKDISEIDRQLSIMFEINCPANNISSFISAFSKSFERNEKKAIDKQKKELQEKTAGLEKSYEEKFAELVKAYEEKSAGLEKVYEEKATKLTKDYEKKILQLNKELASIQKQQKQEAESKEENDRKTERLVKMVDSLRAENDKLHTKVGELTEMVSEITKENEDLKKNGNRDFSEVETEMLKLELTAYKQKVKELLGRG